MLEKVDLEQKSKRSLKFTVVQNHHTDQGASGMFTGQQSVYTPTSQIQMQSRETLQASEHLCVLLDVHGLELMFGVPC